MTSCMLSLKMQHIGFICKMDPKPRNLLERVTSLTLWVEKYAQSMSYRMFLFVSVSRPMFEIRRWTEWWNKQNPIFGALHQSTNLEFEVSYNWNDADLLDKENKNSLWKEATNTELTELNDYEAFEKNGRGAKLPNSYQNIRVRCETWSQKKSMTCSWWRYDRSTKRQYLFKRGIFWEGWEWLSYLLSWMVLNYVLLTFTVKLLPERSGISCWTRFWIIELYHLKFADNMHDLSSIQSKADPDAWMLDRGTYYEYCDVWVDNIYMLEKAEKFCMRNWTDLALSWKVLVSPSTILVVIKRGVQEP